MKILNGSELAGYIKENQAHRVRNLSQNGDKIKLLILRDNDKPVIDKYVHLKQRYGQDLGILVEDWCGNDLEEKITSVNNDEGTDAIIVQLPLLDVAATDRVVKLINPEKDVDGLADGNVFDSATATAINWLLAGYNINLEQKRIAIVGYGRLIGRPLSKMWQNSGYNVTVFRHGDDLDTLKHYDLIVSATGVPHLIKSHMVKAGAIVIDAGTASEGGILVGDVDDEVRQRSDLSAITPKVGGVGPLTVAALFEHVIIAAENHRFNRV